MRHGVRFYIKGEGWQKLPFSEFLSLLNYRVNCCHWWCVVCKQYYILNLKLSVHRMLVVIKSMHVVCIIINKTEYYEILTIKCTQLSSYHKLTTFGSKSAGINFLTGSSKGYCTQYTLKAYGLLFSKMLFWYVLAGVSALLMSILVLFSYQAFVDNLDVKFEVYAVYIHIVFFKFLSVLGWIWLGLMMFCGCYLHGHFVWRIVYVISLNW